MIPFIEDSRSNTAKYAENKCNTQEENISKTKKIKKQNTGHSFAFSCLCSTGCTCGSGPKSSQENLSSLPENPEYCCDKKFNKNLFSIQDNKNSLITGQSTGIKVQKCALL